MGSPRTQQTHRVLAMQTTHRDEFIQDAPSFLPVARGITCHQRTDQLSLNTDGRFDLIVLSEVPSFRDIAAVAARVVTALDTDGVVLSANWRGHGNDPCGAMRQRLSC